MSQVDRRGVARTCSVLSLVVHPMERLRYIARSRAVGQQLLVEEAATALASLADDHNQLVMACRQMISHHSTSGAIVALAARLLTASDPRQEAWEVVEEVRSDRSTEHLVYSLASQTTIFVSRWSEHIDVVLADRPDVSLVASIEDSAVVLIEADAASPVQLLVDSSNAPLLAEAKDHGAQLWAVAAYGSILPASLFAAVVVRAGRGSVVLEIADVDRVVCNDGALSRGLLLKSTCPYAAELA
ncbi:MAG: hypothetical protein V3V01_08120 [Acidimicrobiales bacterium]